MKISIVIPVYNSSKYLKKCVDSVINQTYKNFEVLLIDDESSDGSELICDEYSKNDERIITIHKKNGGTSSARNVGIKKSTGDYVTFVDNDDYWKDERSLENCVKLLEESNADILLHECITYWEKDDKCTEGKSHFDRSELIGKNTFESLKVLIQNGILSYTVWDKIVKRDLIIKHNIYFSEGKRNEDSEWVAKLLFVAEKMDYSNEKFYIYRKQHEGAQTTKGVSYQLTLDLKNIIINYIDKIEHEISSNEFKYVFYNYFSYLYAVYIGQTLLVNDDRIKDDLKVMKKYKYLLKYDLNPNMKKVKLVYSILGFNATKYILAFYMKKKYNLKRK